MISTLLGPLPAALVALIGYAASALTLLCVVPLCVATWRGRAQPSPVTWTVWALVGIVATVAMARGGAPAPAWLLKGALSLGPVAVAVVAAVRGVRWQADVTDRGSLVLGLVGTAIYAFTGQGLAAVYTAMLVDAVGAVPTWRRAWSHPYGELVLTYALALASVVAVLVTLPLPWTALSAAYLSFLAVQMASIIAVLVAGRRRVRAAALARVTR